MSAPAPDHARAFVAVLRATLLASERERLRAEREAARQRPQKAPPKEAT